MSAGSNAPAGAAHLAAGPGGDAWAIGEPRLLRGFDAAARLDLTTHTRIHGALAWPTRQQLELLCEEVGLLGRGGAGFPVVLKLRSLPKKGATAVVVNGAESEPASWKDRTLMRRAPHLIIDGALVVAHATRATDVLIVVHDEEAAVSLRLALVERPDGARLRIVMSPGRFVSGEARAAISAAENKPAVPGGRRILPTHSGYRNGPTFLSNAETFAQLALLARRGSAYADTGISTEPGTTLLTVAGAVDRAGVVEVPIGIALASVLDVVAVRPGATILLGGYHGTFVPDARSVSLSRKAVAAQGATMGAGVVLALDRESCPLAELEAVSRYLAAESAGQCGPCVFGLASVARDVAALRRGDPVALRDLQRHLGIIPGRGACAHPDGVSRFVASALTTFAADIRAHTESGAGGCGRPYRGELPLPLLRPGGVR